MRRKAKRVFSAVAATLSAFMLFESTAMAAVNTNTINVLDGNGGVFVKGYSTKFETNR